MLYDDEACDVLSLIRNVACEKFPNKSLSLLMDGLAAVTLEELVLDELVVDVVLLELVVVSSEVELLVDACVLVEVVLEEELVDVVVVKLELVEVVVFVELRVET